MSAGNECRKSHGSRENEGKTPSWGRSRETYRALHTKTSADASPAALAAPVQSPGGQFRAQCNHHRLDSLGGKSTFVTIVTTVTMSSVVIMLVSFCIWMIRSSTQPADSLASASWSQHSSIVSQSIAMPCEQSQGRKKEKQPQHQSAELAAVLLRWGHWAVPIANCVLRWTCPLLTRKLWNICFETYRALCLIYFALLKQILLSI